MANIPDSVIDNALASLRQPLHRPNPLQWLKYAVGGSLPKRCGTWVLHDVTAPTWVLRHAVRSLVLLAIPVLAVLLFLPTSLNVRLLVLANAGLPAFVASMIFVLPANERRLVRAGYPAELGQAIRGRRAVEKQVTSNRARRERMAARRARRLGMVDAAFPAFQALPASLEPSDNRNWWEVLGVARDADPVQTKRAYLEQAKRWHPDNPDGDAVRFGHIKRAYEQALSAQARRQFH
jgi:hypothetical protein